MSSPCATRHTVVTRAAITSATGDLCAASPQPLWAPTLSNPPTGSAGAFLHSASPLSGPDPGPLPHPPSRALSPCPPAQTPPANPSSAALPAWAPAGLLSRGSSSPLPGTTATHMPVDIPCSRLWVLWAAPHFSPFTWGAEKQEMLWQGWCIYLWWFRALGLLDHKGCGISMSKTPSQILPYFKPQYFHSGTHGCAASGIPDAC